MISASSAFLAKVNDGSIPRIRVLLTLADNSTMWIENTDIWANSVSFQEATSSDSSFDVGSAIIGSFNFTINNFNGTYTTVDFSGSTVQPYLYYPTDGTVEYLPKGIFYVASHKTVGNIINVTSLDALKLLDNTDTPITYPTTVQNLVDAICTSNGITLETATVPNGSFTLEDPKLNENEYYTDRQKLSYACQCIGNYARMTENGTLRIGWYNFLTPVQITSTFDGKSLSTSTFQVTGLRFELNTETDTTTYLYGTDDVVVEIGANPFINADNINTVCTYISANIFNKTFRSGTLPILSNPCLQAGDTLEVTDNVTSNVYVIPITSTTYNKSLVQNINCAFAEKEDIDLRPSSEYRIKAAVQNATSIAQGAQSAVNTLSIEVNRVAAIADNTNQYFWFKSTGSDTGAHITEIPQEDFLDDPTNGGGNLLARSNGVAVRDGLTELAVFGADGVRVGSDTNSNFFQITPNEIMMIDADGVDIFAIDRGGAAEEAVLSKTVENTFHRATATYDSGGYNHLWYTLPITNYVSGGNLKIVLEVQVKITSTRTSYHKYVHSLAIGTSNISTIGLQGVNIKLYYGEHSVKGLDIELRRTASENNRYFRVASITYDGYVLMPSYTIGTRASTESNFGSYSVAIGEMLTASGDRQTVIGKYNVEDTNNTYALIVGNGTSSTPSNAMTLDWNGHLVTGDGFNSALYPRTTSHPVTVTYAAGTIGTRGAAVSACTLSEVCPTDYKLGAVYISQFANSSLFQAEPVINGDRLYVCAYRATGNAVSDIDVTATILWIPDR